MIRRIIPILISFSLALLLVLSACRKDDTINKSPSVRLEFSSDTLIFDTVFTSIGSITEQIRVRNTSDEKINISRIKLARGAESRYSINVNGMAGNDFQNIEIRGNDSIYIFAKVTINPNDATAPFVITDSIVFDINGNQQDVDLVAWGQNAHYILWDTDRPNLPRYKIVAGEGIDTTWTNELPIVVYGYAVVDSTGSLTINAGT
ncbi:MAG: hypothetical protein PHH42_15445, partial [Bacteroidales bacterium]|nr:hypothetical protein [Bacteroidales bacterium]